MTIYLKAHQGWQGDDKPKIVRSRYRGLAAMFPEISESWKDKIHRAVRINKELDAEFRRIVR